MRKDEALYQYLAASPGIVALAGERIYPLRLPQRATFPALVFIVGISTDAAYSHDGDSRADTDRCQLDAYGVLYGDAQALGVAVQQALSGVVATAGGVRIGPAFKVLGPRPSYEEAINAYRVTLDFRVAFGGYE